jgi:hypothetical protein
MNQLVLSCKENDFKPPVESKVLRKRGIIRGTRLIVFDSLMEYLHGLDGGGRNDNCSKQNSLLQSHHPANRSFIEGKTTYR